jgi:hypothetical protein
MAYSLQTGLWKTIKNGLVVLAPALAAGYMAFLAAAPAEWQQPISVIAGFAGYFVKNWFSNR